MAHFRGTVRGGRGTASRLGHATTGLHANARSWNGEVDVILSVRNGQDWASVIMTDGEQRRITLYYGPLARYRPMRKGERIDIWPNQVMQEARELPDE